MFGGNAKTHFQVLGKGENNSGYMMSPFGDERWDIDDLEKMKKIRPRMESSSQYRDRKIPAVRTMNTNQYYSPSPPACNEIGYQQTLRGRESEPQLGYQRTPYTTSSQFFYPKQSQYQEVTENQYRMTRQQQQQQQQHQQQQQPQLQMQIPQQTYQDYKFNLPQTKNGLQDVRNDRGYICQTCKSQLNWKSGPDVPVSIPGQIRYNPLGPYEIISNSSRSQTGYMPLS